jgi:perosamine synthetase
MDPNLLEDFLKNQCDWRQGALWNRQTGRRVKAIEPVHLLGHPVEFDPILALARKYHLLVVEDAAESLGTRYRDRRVAGLGDLGCLSFNGNKLITTGGGGMILTNHEHLAARARYLTTQAKDDPVEYIHHEIGYNYRLPNLLAAFGCAQLEQIDAYIASKRSTAARYHELLAETPGISCFTPSAQSFCTWWLYTIRITASQFGIGSRELRESLERRSIQTRPLWQPLHASRAHRGAQVLSRGVADQLFRECLSLPSSVGLSPSQIEFVANCIREIQSHASSHCSSGIRAA